MLAVDPSPVVTVRGQGELEVAPDLADFSLALTATGPSAGDVRAALARSANALGEQVRALGPAIERSTTGSLWVTPVYDRKQTSVRGYRGTVSLEVRVADFAVFDSLVRLATSQPECTVAGPHWSLRPANPAHREARLAAVQDARSRAEDYAGAFGLALGDLLEVSDLREAGFARPMRMAAVASRMLGEPDEPPLELDPVPQSVSAEVTVRFALAGRA